MSHRTNANMSKSQRGHVVLAQTCQLERKESYLLSEPKPYERVGPAQLMEQCQFHLGKRRIRQKELGIKKKGKNISIKQGASTVCCPVSVQKK